MRSCALCGHLTLGSGDICAFHHLQSDHRWAAGNRIFCDFLHRGIVPPAPPDSDRRLEPDPLEDAAFP